MFMIPIPPTTKRHPGDRTKQDRHHRGRRRRRIRDLLLSAHREIIVAASPDVMPLTQQRDDLLLARAHFPGSPTWTLMLRKVVPPSTRFIALE